MRRLARSSGWTVAAALFAVHTYLLSLVAAAARSGRGHLSASLPGAPLRMVVLVPAHDEELGIEESVSSLVQQRYPAEARRIVVIADNCTDRTAELAARAGAEVWVRTDLENRGKGQALAWALERLWRTSADVEVVLMVDADCSATPNLLEAVDARMRRGASVVQVDDRVARPDESRAAARRWAGFALRHAVRANGKSRVGLSSGLFGTGMAFRSEVLRSRPWESFSITEDAEFHVQLIESGHRVVFAAEAAVESAMPSSEAAAQQQQLRWEAGNVALLRRTLPRLLAAGVRRRDVQRINAALEQLVPPQSMLAVLSLLAGLLGALGRDRRLITGALASSGAQAAFIVSGLAVARAPRSVWSALVTAPLLVPLKVLQIGRILTGRGPTQWVRTARVAREPVGRQGAS